MRRRSTTVGILTVAALASIASSCYRNSEGVIGAGYPYSPAFLDDHPRALRIFRLSGGENDLAMPAALSQITYDPGGGDLYGFVIQPDPRIGFRRLGPFKFELDSRRLSLIPGSPELGGAAGIAVSSGGQRIILSGRYHPGSSAMCGLFELRPDAGKLRILARNPNCGSPSGPWTHLSLSPDGERVLALDRAGMKIINLATGTVEPLLGSFQAGAWSPDGRWLAVVEDEGGHRTLVLDAKTLRQDRTFGTSLAQWSPDSRYLLALGGFCGPYYSTLEVIDVESGQRLRVGSSWCKVNLGTTGWVRTTTVQ